MKTWSRSLQLLVKALILGGLTVVMLVSLLLVNGVITDRQQYREQAVTSIAQSYATEQRVAGPLLVVPYRHVVEHETTENGVKKTTAETVVEAYTYFPENLDVKGAMTPSLRRHGMYKVPVYEFAGTLSGRFHVPAPPAGSDAAYGVPYLAFTVKDARGIVSTPAVRVDGAAVTVAGSSLTAAEQASVAHPDLLWGTNLRALVPGEPAKGMTFDFAMDLTLGGTQKLELVPVGSSNHFEVNSPWAAPLFAGAFLPRERTISKDGFRAAWDVSSLASGTQQQLRNHSEALDVVSVSLAELMDPYSLSERAVKYGILFVMLTFGGFFLFELVKQMRMHPVQYLLVGFCQAVFFLLLVSFSERLGFGAAYLLACVACIGLLTYYLAFVLKSRTYGLMFGGILTALYAAIYGLLVSEDNALLLGSVLLFGLIALVMVLTRKVDWYKRTGEEEALGVNEAQG